MIDWRAARRNSASVSRGIVPVEAGRESAPRQVSRRAEAQMR